jgi:putrescine transport system permease protein
MKFVSNKLNNWIIYTPYFWLVLFFFVPLSLIFKISISVAEWGMPPYQDLFIWDNGFFFNATLENYLYILTDSYYLTSFFNSLKLAFISTLFCILIGYPIAFFIATSSNNTRNILLILIIIPFWSSFLLRVYAWKIILQSSGVINTLLLNFGFIDEPLQLLYNQYAVLIGVIYTYLPLMILPLYGFLVKFDLTLVDAAHDLGSNKFFTFFRIVLPLSIPGILAGSLLVFIPVVGEFIIPEMLGGSDKLYYGKILWEEFFVNRNWPSASALAFLGIIVLVMPIIIFQILYSKWSNKNEI